MSELYMPDLTNFSWQPPVIEKTGLVPTSPVVGNKYIITGGVSGGAWDGYTIGNIAWYVGTSKWEEVSVPIGAMTYNIDESTFYYKSSSSAWVEYNAGSGTWQPVDTVLSDISAQEFDVDDFIIATGTSAVIKKTPTEIKEILDLEIGTDVQAHSAILDTFSTAGLNTDDFIVAKSSVGVEGITASQARTVLGLVVGTNVQAQDPTLQSIADISTIANNSFLIGTGVGNGIETQTASTVMHTLSGQATSSFDFHSQNVNGVNAFSSSSLNSGSLNIGSSPTTFTKIEYDADLKAVVFTY